MINYIQSSLQPSGTNEEGLCAHPEGLFQRTANGSERAANKQFLVEKSRVNSIFSK